MTVIGLDHVQLAMPPGGEEMARRFYGNVLGLSEIDKPAALRPRGGVWFLCGDRQLHLGVEAAFRPASKAHPALVVDDLAGHRQQLNLAGAPIVEDDAVPEVERLYTADPFGNRIELIQRVKG